MKEFINELKIRISILKNDRKSAKYLGMTLRQYHKMEKDMDKQYEKEMKENPKMYHDIWDDPIVCHR